MIVFYKNKKIGSQVRNQNRADIFSRMNRKYTRFKHSKHDCLTISFVRAAENRSEQLL